MSLAEKRVRERIQACGPISFEELMEIALYDPDCGYYARGREIGARGDFHTVAHLDPLFGEILADCFVRWMSGSHELVAGFDIVELGAGTGRLAADILFSLSARFSEIGKNVRYFIDDISWGYRRRQAQLLANYPSVAWQALQSFSPDSITGIVFSNELFDALPCRRFRRRADGWLELRAGLRDDRLVWVESESINGPAAEQWKQSHAEVQAGNLMEFSPGAETLLRLISSRLRTGYVVTIDYGGERRELIAHQRGEGTLRCFREHQINDDPLAHLGEQDITYSVDFTRLREIGEEAGLETLSCETLEEFLQRERILERIGEILSLEGGTLAGSRSFSLKHFVMPSAFIRNFKVLIQGRR